MLKPKTILGLLVFNITCLSVLVLTFLNRGLFWSAIILLTFIGLIFGVINHYYQLKQYYGD